MSRRAAAITQVDVARALRAAKQAGAEVVEIAPGGVIRILLKTTTPATPPEPEDDRPEIIL